MSFARVATLVLTLASGSIARQAAAQGLREEVLQFMGEVDAGGGNPCTELARATELLGIIDAGQAEPYMVDETRTLRALRETLTESCGAFREGDEESLRLASLLSQCESLGQARAACALLRQCGPVRALSDRMRAFWVAAEQLCPGAVAGGSPDQ